MYLFIIFSLLSLSNIYVIWLLIELMFLFFLLIVLNKESKSIGLVIYFFFQSVASLFLFIRIYFFFDKFIFLLLCAKLGLFPFFYWIVVVSVKVELYGNIFVLGLQKIRVFWLVWLTLTVRSGFIYLMAYLRIFFVILRLLMISDFWLLLVYSSIANTGILLISTLGSNFIIAIGLYLAIIMSIIYSVKQFRSYTELILVVFIFLVIPPFILFFIKFYVILSLDYFLKLGFFIAFFDVFVLLYYFRIVFIKFILLDVGVVIYFINLLILLCILLFRNCVAMIVFN